MPWFGSKERGIRMSQPYTLQFIHRLNEDGTIDSICRDCFLTVATSTSEADLERGERKHACDPQLIERYKKVRVQGKLFHRLA